MATKRKPRPLLLREHGTTNKIELEAYIPGMAWIFFGTPIVSSFPLTTAHIRRLYSWCGRYLEWVEARERSGS